MRDDLADGGVHELDLLQQLSAGHGRRVLVAAVGHARLVEDFLRCTPTGSSCRRPPESLPARRCGSCPQFHSAAHSPSARHSTGYFRSCCPPTKAGYLVAESWRTKRLPRLSRRAAERQSSPPPANSSHSGPLPPAPPPSNTTGACRSKRCIRLLHGRRQRSYSCERSSTDTPERNPPPGPVPASSGQSKPRRPRSALRPARRRSAWCRQCRCPGRCRLLFRSVTRKACSGPPAKPVPVVIAGGSSDRS